MVVQVWNIFCNKSHSAYIFVHILAFILTTRHWRPEMNELNQERFWMFMSITNKQHYSGVKTLSLFFYPFQNGMYFYTPDRYDQHLCAKHQGCGWWFNYCAFTLPNGRFYPGGAYEPGPGQYYDGIYWRDWLGFGYSMKFFSMSLYQY